MAEKFSCLVLAALANDVDNPLLKGILGAGSLYFGITGARRGSEAVGQYRMEAAALTRELQTTTDVVRLAVVNTVEPVPVLP